MSEGRRPNFRRWARLGGGWEGTGPCPDWAEAILAQDPDVLINDYWVEVLHREGESSAEYHARSSAVAPPLPEEVRELIRDGVIEYWQARRSQGHELSYPHPRRGRPRSRLRSYYPCNRTIRPARPAVAILGGPRPNVKRPGPQEGNRASGLRAYLVQSERCGRGRFVGHQRAPDSSLPVGRW